MNNTQDPMYPPDYGQSNNSNVPSTSPEYTRHQNRIAVISMICAGLGMLSCVGALLWILVLRGEYQTGFIISSNNVTNLLERILIYGLGLTLGGMLSLVGFVLGISSLDSKLALFAIIVSMIGPLCMLGWFLSLIFWT